ncbi:uncharacterized protein N7498_005530 [Penicillium cinerascens]|uniref:Uncharacterized protein n=1 Tax=Penicillium cinerascens TaxID=70096 RepID=A0A9W9T0H0_9EURO|nr:uncharacterized protein N7498_005530 [Penicillium cinerascens]KAJ5204651.1 hypothetical protein N7498_005530 [Penicillium cinerascens]
MQFSKTLVSLVALALGANAGVPVASVELQSWEAGNGCDAGYPAHGEPMFKAAITATSITCDKTTINRQWNVDFYSLKAVLDTKDAFLCEGVSVFNTDDCSGELKYFLPFHGSPIEQGVCISEAIFDPGFLSVRLECPGFAGGAFGGSSAGHKGPDGY